MILLLLATLSTTHHCSAQYHGPSDGSERKPWQWQRCLRDGFLVPGDTAVFLKGQYDCSHGCRFRQDGVTYEGREANIIDFRRGLGTGTSNTVEVHCDSCTVKGFKIRNLNWSRQTETPIGVIIYGQGIVLEDMEISNTYIGIFTTLNATTTARNIKIQDVGANGKGHGMYIQGPTVVENVKVCGAERFGLQVWSTFPTADVTIMDSMTTDSRVGGFAVGGAGGYTNIRILRSAFISKPPYSSEGVHVYDGGTLTVEKSLLQGGVVLQSNADVGNLVLQDNTIYGGVRAGGAIQVPVWDFDWTPQNYCQADTYCKWETQYPTNVWDVRGAGCTCGVGL